VTTEAVSLFLALLALLAEVAVVAAAGLAVGGRMSPRLARARDQAVAAVAPAALPLALAVAAVAMAGSLYFSEVAHFTPCRLCWYQRICMYPLSITTLLLALANDHRPARYLLPFPVVGSGIAVYHLLVENGVVGQSSSCLISAPGGCGVKWIDELGYVTIPTLALTGFALAFAFLLLAAFAPGYGEGDER
jgi:disulfide bond formation protein DsbB